MEALPHSESPRVASALAILRANGERVTPARYAVLRVVEAADLSAEHLSADTIGARVSELEPTVHRATVYRTLTALTELGVLTHVHLAAAGTVYHLADPLPEAAAPTSRTSVTDHAHVQCVECGAVLDVPPSVLDEVAVWLRDALGFELDTSHAALLGRCRDCLR
ncbi:MAG TPA: Fur family transcriptional regulator [Intrasporangium sp.]|uniref:Fur family transcriptional regulator n=1 Tax=Intrasporangium sp. TaxID=1925024 RepID=UPI002D787F15|nr:Fur family transcriptional regulator [Intrasporangium sp.]HET7397150.1 Fur family transcriptional regulator [Intrasporangium sp.]